MEGGDDQPWLFKFTRDNTGEDWSEKIASELAKLLNIPAAQVELATFMGKRGCASQSFVFTEKGFELVHGSEVLAGSLVKYEKSKQWGQNDHSIENIVKALEEIFPSRQRTQYLRILASYIILDALICNTDRHHDNWGVLRYHTQQGKTMHEIAPSFDHASSLGRELLDERRQAILDQNDIERYVLRGHGGIFLEKPAKKGENPLLLAINAARYWPNYFSPCLKRLKNVREEEIIGIVDRVPIEWMNTVAKEFCCRILTTTLKRLNEV